MTTSENLEAIKEMQKDWIDCINNTELIYQKNCNKGFCLWIHIKGYDRQSLLTELLKDYTKKQLNEHWYRIYEDLGRQALVTRLNHLNRTIERLENQIKKENLWHSLKKSI